MESSETVKNRATEFFHNIILMSALVNLKEPSILVVAHGKVIQQLFKKFFEEMDCVGAVPGLRLFYVVTRKYSIVRIFFQALQPY